MKRTSLFCRAVLAAVVAAAGTLVAQEAPAKRPAFLILPGHGYSPLIKLDYPWMNELHKHGLDLDVRYAEKLPAAEELAKFNVLVILNLPPFAEATCAQLDLFLKAGGGLFLMPDVGGYAGTLHQVRNWENFLKRWGARIPLEHVHDLTTVKTHPRSTRRFIYTDKILPSPVSDGVKALWFPGGEEDNWAWHAFGQAIDLNADWTPVVRGGDASFTKPMKEVGNSAEHDLLREMFFRADPTKPPVLFALREVGNGRVALMVSDPILHLYGGTSWIHDGVMLNKGLENRPGDFGKLFENTVRWLAEPTLANGALGGYTQDPLALRHPNQRKKPEEYFGEFDSYQNPTPPARVFRGVIGPRTAFSSGTGTVAEWAAAARAGKLDFLVFMEDLAKLSEANYQKLEKECKEQSTADLCLVPGIGMKNNIGNFMWSHGYGIQWFKPSQLTGPDKDQLRLQCFDKDGKLTYSDEDAKNWLWTVYGVSGRNTGYYDFTGNPGVPVRNLRLFGILALITYRDGRPIEDLTDAYLDYVVDGCPPLACAVDVMKAPADLSRTAGPGYYLTHVAAQTIEKVPEALQYGHQYGRPNVYVSSGPQIRCWAGTQRFSSYAGESFVTARRRARPELWVQSDAGLKEIVIYCDRKPYRRLLLNGDQEFHTAFEWAYDRHRELVAVATDVTGGRAVSASRSLWSDTNYSGWCNDRQNGEVWHGPIVYPAPRRPLFSVGPTWDGGPPPPAFGNLENHPAVATRTGELEGFWRFRGGRWMEGNQYPTCYDDTVANGAVDAECVYAPGVVANAYHTLGPCEPSQLFTFSLRRTQFMQRPAGVNLDWHPMYPERAGGCTALMEGVVTLRKDMDLEGVHVVTIMPHSYPKDGTNVPLLAVNTGDGVSGIGPVETFDGPHSAAGLGPKLGNTFLLQPGGYVAILPTRVGHATVVFNAGTEPLRANASKGFGAWGVTAAKSGPAKAGEQMPFRYLALYDGVEEPVINTLRVDSLRRYFGFTGENGCGIQVKAGKLLRQDGMIELAAQDGKVEFEVPNPGWRVNQPLGLRICGLNPNWTVGEWQIDGYSQHIYADGRNLYRQLGMDDRNLIHLSLYPDQARTSHSVIGHPVQCDRPDLIIEVTQLSAKPYAYQVAVNNPTDTVLRTTLRKTMDLPGFVLADTAVEVPPGGYKIVSAPLAAAGVTK